MGILHHMREDLLSILTTLSTQSPSTSYQYLLSFLQQSSRSAPKLAEKQFQKLVDSHAKIDEMWQLLACVRDIKSVDEIGSVERVLLMDASVGEHVLLDKVRQVLDKKSKYMILSAKAIMINIEHEFSVRDIFKLLIFVHSLVSPDISFVRKKELRHLITDILLTIPQRHDLGWLDDELKKQISEYLSNEKNIEENEEEEDEENWDNWDDEQDDDDFGVNKKKSYKESHNADLLRKKVEEVVAHAFAKLDAITKQRSTLKIFE